MSLLHTLCTVRLKYRSRTELYKDCIRRLQGLDNFQVDIQLDTHLSKDTSRLSYSPCIQFFLHYSNLRIGFDILFSSLYILLIIKIIP